MGQRHLSIAGFSTSSHHLRKTGVGSEQTKGTFSHERGLRAEQALQAISVRDFDLFVRSQGREQRCKGQGQTRLSYASGSVKQQVMATSCGNFHGPFGMPLPTNTREIALWVRRTRIHHAGPFSSITY